MLEIVQGADHFSLLQQFTTPESALFRRVSDLLVGTSLNRNPMLDTASAAMHSPLHRLKPGCPAALFAVGADETPAFIEQSRHMCEGWQRAGNVR